MLEAAQEAEEGGCEAAGRGGRLVLLLPPSATIIPAVKRNPMALPLPMFLVWLAGNAQTVPCVGGGRVERCTRSEGDIARRHEGLGNDNCSRSRRRQACKPTMQAVARKSQGRQANHQPHFNPPPSQ